MRILVTGGAGFIGSHLCDRLIQDGHAVLCVDNLFTGSERNVAQLSSRQNFSFIHHDIVDPLYVEGVIDQIYNLACPASPVQYQQNPVHTIKASTLGVINMLGLARKHGARILQTSTSEVYGEPQVHPQVEEYYGNVNPVGPRACYDEGKRCAETLFFDYHRMHGMEIKVVRLFNVYGPRMGFHDGRVVSNFILQALQEKPLTVDGNGTQTRSFCYIDDLIDGLVKMMNSPSELMGPINLGNPVETTINEFGNRIIELTGSPSALSYSGIFRVNDPMQRCPNITKAKELLGWKPTVQLEEGLKRTITNFRERLAV